MHIYVYNFFWFFWVYIIFYMVIAVYLKLPGISSIFFSSLFLPPPPPSFCVRSLHLCGWRRMSGILLSLSPPYSPEAESLTEPGGKRPASPGDTLSPHSARVPGQRGHAWLFLECQDWNSGPRGCPASILSHWATSPAAGGEFIIPHRCIDFDGTISTQATYSPALWKLLSQRRVTCCPHSDACWKNREARRETHLGLSNRALTHSRLK